MTIRSTPSKLTPDQLTRGVFAGLAASFLWQAPAGDALAQRLDAVLDRWVAQERIVGAVVLVARDGEARRAARPDTTPASAG